MKIAIALSDIKSTGGVARVVTNIANSLVKVPGYDVEIISCFKSIRENVSYNIDDNIKIRYVNLDMNVKKNKLMKQIYFLKEIRSILKYSNSDVLISTNAHLNIYSIIATLGLKTKVLGSEHGAYNHLSIGWRILTQVFYRYLDKLILLTSKEKHKYKLKENKIAIIPNMIDNSNKKLSSLNNNNIVMVNRIDDNKNIFVELEVFSKVLKNNNNYKLNIY